MTQQRAVKCPTVIPEWLKLIAKDGRVSGKDVADLFGYSKKGFTDAVYFNRFPKPDFKDKREFATGCPTRATWKPATIINEIKRRAAANEAL